MATQGTRSVEHVAEFLFGIGHQDPPKATATFLRLRRKDNGEEVDFEKEQPSLKDDDTELW